MKEKNRNNLKIERQQRQDDHSYIKSPLSRHHHSPDTNRSIFSQEKSIIDFTPVTHADKEIEYRKALQLSEANHKIEALKIMNRLFQELCNALRVKKTEFILMVNILLNLWKIQSEVEELSCNVVEKLRKHIPAILGVQKGFRDLHQKVSNRINLLLIIYIKEEFENENYHKANELAKQYQERINADGKSNDLKLKFRFIRIKIFNKLNKAKEELQEITACQSLFKGYGKKKDIQIGIEHKSKELLKAKLQTRKNQLKEQMKRASSQLSKPPQSSLKNGPSNFKTLKLLNLESTANTFIKNKNGRSLSLNKLQRNPSVAQSKTNKQQKPSKYGSEEKNESHKTSTGFLPLNSNQGNWHSIRGKGKTVHLQSSQPNAEKATNKNKIRPELQYKKLTKKTLLIKYKESDFKDTLADLKHEQNVNAFQDMLLQRPFAERKDKNKIKQSFGQKDTLNESPANMPRNIGNQQTTEEKNESALVDKKDGMIHECVKEIQKETLERFYTFLQYRKNEADNSVEELFNSDDSDGESSEVQSKQPIDQEVRHISTTNNRPDAFHSEVKLSLDHIFLPNEQNSYAMKLVYNQSPKFNKQKDSWVKIWLSNYQKQYFFTMKMPKPKSNEQIFSDSFEKMENNSQDFNDLEIITQKQKLLEHKAMERQQYFLKYFRDMEFLRMFKLSINVKNKTIGKKKAFVQLENEDQFLEKVSDYIEAKTTKNELFLSKESVRIYVQCKKTFECMQEWYSSFVIPEDKDEVLLNYIQHNQKGPELKTLVASPFAWKNKRTICKLTAGLSKDVSSHLEQKKQKEYSKMKLQKIEVSTDVNQPRCCLGWISIDAVTISQYLMDNNFQQSFSSDSCFYLAVKSFLMVDQPSIKNIISMFFNVHSFTYVSSLGKNQGSKSKTYKISIQYYEVKDLYQLNRTNLPIFMKFKIEDSHLKNHIHKFILTDSDVKKILGSHVALSFSSQNHAEFFKIFQSISQKVFIYKKLTYSHVGVVTNSDKLNNVYQANRQKYINNEFLMKPSEYLSPHLESINIVYQGPIRIQCDKTYAIITVLKVKETHLFDLRIYVPKYQRIYSFSFSHQIFQYFNRNQLHQIFSPNTEQNMKNSRNIHKTSISLEGIKNCLYSQNSDKAKGIWSRIVRIFKFQRKFNAERSYLIVKISNYEAFTKDCAICEYFTVANCKTSAKGERKESESIIRIQISMEMNKSGLNFLPKINKNNKRKERSVKTVFAERQLCHNASEQNSGDSSKTYHESLQNIYESETNKYIIYLSFTDILTSQKVVYSYFLCQLVHLLEAQDQVEHKADNRDSFPPNSLFFKQKTLNHAALSRILNGLKNIYQLKLQSEAKVYMPNFFKKKELMDFLKRDVDCELLKNKKSQKISLNAEIFPHSKNSLQKDQETELACESRKILKRYISEQKKIPRISMLPSNSCTNIGEDNEELQGSVMFLHRKILLSGEKHNPISCIIYDSYRRTLNIYINNYKKAKIKELEIDSKDHSIPNMYAGEHPDASILKAMRKRLYRYHQNLMMLM